MWPYFLEWWLCKSPASVRCFDSVCLYQEGVRGGFATQGAWIHLSGLCLEVKTLRLYTGRIVWRGVWNFYSTMYDPKTCTHITIHGR